MAIHAQTYSSEKLRKAAEVLGIHQKVKTLPLDMTQKLEAKDGQVVCVRTSASQVVEHIGLPLFSDDMRVLMPSPVYDFLEYAALNWKYKFNPNTLYLSKVIFKKGSWSTLFKEKLPECDCSISNEGDRLYIVSWQRDSQEVAVVGIPIEYELLSNDSRRNMEREFVRQLADFRVPDTVSQPKPVTEDELTVYGTEGLFVVGKNWYLMPELNQNVYYSLVTVTENVDTVVRNKPETMTLETVVPVIVSSEEHPAETFANLMLAERSVVPDASVRLDIHLSNYHREQMTIPLSQLTGYCQQQGCNIFFACSGIENDTVRGMLFASNTAQGYNHLFSARIPVSQLTAPKPEVQIAAYLYIPPVDESHLFGKMPTKKSGQIKNVNVNENSKQ